MVNHDHVAIVSIPWGGGGSILSYADYQNDGDNLGMDFHSIPDILPVLLVDKMENCLYG